MWSFPHDQKPDFQIHFLFKSEHSSTFLRPFLDLFLNRIIFSKLYSYLITTNRSNKKSDHKQKQNWLAYAHFLCTNLKKNIDSNCWKHKTQHKTFDHFQNHARNQHFIFKAKPVSHQSVNFVIFTLFSLHDCLVICLKRFLFWIQHNHLHNGVPTFCF